MNQNINYPMILMFFNAVALIANAILQIDDEQRLSAQKNLRQILKNADQHTHEGRMWTPEQKMADLIRGLDRYGELQTILYPKSEAQG